MCVLTLAAGGCSSVMNSCETGAVWIAAVIAMLEFQIPTSDAALLTRGKICDVRLHI